MVVLLQKICLKNYLALAAENLYPRRSRLEAEERNNETATRADIFDKQL